MKKTILFLIIIAFVFCSVSTYALPRRKKGEKAEAEKQIEKNEKGGKVRSVFFKTVKGQLMVFIRLTPGQFITGKLRAKIKRRPKSLVRAILRIRQRRLLKKGKKAYKLKGRIPLVIRIPSKMLRKRGLKSLYVVRPASILFRGETDSFTDKKPIAHTE